MAYDVSYSTLALNSLTQIESYLNERSPSGAKNVLTEIKSTIDLLTIYPLLGVKIEGLSFRFQITKKYRYRIVYLITNWNIYITQIYHPRQLANTEDQDTKPTL